jgi:acetyltransferase-like isoleucine patch superfamily enzyme
MSEFPKDGVKYHPNSIKGSLVAEPPISFHAVVKGHCSIGYLSYIGKNSEIYNTDIGRFCSIANNFTSGPTNHPTDRISSHLFSFANHGPFKDCPEYLDWMRKPALESNSQRVIIGNDVWIGRDVTIKRGIKIGDGAIIGAGSVITKDVPEYSIVGGIPAKFIRSRFDEQTIARLKAIKWFNFDLRKSQIPDLDMTDILTTLDTLELLLSKNQLKPLSCQKLEICHNGTTKLKHLD